VSSRYLAIAGDKHVAVFHNVAGYHSTIAELESKKKSATTAAMRERLQTQIDEARLVSPWWVLEIDEARLVSP